MRALHDTSTTECPQLLSVQICGCVEGKRNCCCKLVAHQLQKSTEGNLQSWPVVHPSLAQRELSIAQHELSITPLSLAQHRLVIAASIDWLLQVMNTHPLHTHAVLSA